MDQIPTPRPTYIGFMKFMFTPKPLFTTQAKRSTAFVMLLFWLFALTSGVVNACILEGGAAHGDQGAPGHVHATTLATEGSDEPVVTTNDHDVDERSSKAACLKVCADSSQAFAKLSSGIGDPVDPGLAPLFIAVIWTTAAPVASALSRADDVPPPRPREPIGIRFLRLAL